MKSGESTGEGANARKCTNSRDKKRERGADDDGAPHDEERAENVRAEESMGSGENEKKKKKKKKKEDLEEEFTKTFNVERAIVAARNDRKATSDSSLNTEKVNFLSNASTPSARSPTNSAVDKDEKEKPAPKANTKKVRAKTSRLAEAVALSKKNGVKKKINKKRNATARPGNANHGCGEARNEILGHLCSSFSSRVGVDDERLLYANPFPMTATIESIMDFFEKECDGRVLSVRLRRHIASKVFNGSIFVEFATEESAKKVNEKSNALAYKGEKVTTMFKKEYLEKKKKRRR